jgi:hypothetical protein
VRERGRGQVVRWIDIKERKPVEGTHCLLYIPVPEHMTDGYANKGWGGGFCTKPPTSQLGGRCIDGVSHWMPAPERPAQGSKSE